MAEPPDCSPNEAAEFLPAVYEELRRLAASLMRRERASHTLQPTALVHEAYLRLARTPGGGWRNKTHFVAVAAIQMRRVLVDHARKRRAQKKGGGWIRVTLDDQALVATQSTLEILALDEALKRLAALDRRQSEIAVLHLFGGLRDVELAEYLDVSERTVRGDWQVARAWLARELSL